MRFTFSPSPILTTWIPPFQTRPPLAACCSGYGFGWAQLDSGASSLLLHSTSSGGLGLVSSLTPSHLPTSSLLTPRLEHLRTSFINSSYPSVPDATLNVRQRDGLNVSIREAAGKTRKFALQEQIAPKASNAETCLNTNNGAGRDSSCLESGGIPLPVSYINF
ncbi:unnamed protein product [Protopolystoma xenopodis]|uniref:Uncharacterized protein n=1 Tax=Protopolystoma xenopodis TaxID=117903 RepID=A0A3S5BSV6_9PLAT|nr:unnamed protein product [Protopolystoma xenopodis]